MQRMLRRWRRMRWSAGLRGTCREVDRGLLPRLRRRRRSHGVRVVVAGRCLDRRDAAGSDVE